MDVNNKAGEYTVMTVPVPRVLVPANVAKGEVFTIKALIAHPMETGLRKDDAGQIIPRKIINRFVCLYGGKVAFNAELHESISANPFFEFSLRATDSALLKFIWEEDGGAEFRLEHNLVVA
jgi:sulfur-oxidizing protein SoxZ